MRNLFTQIDGAMKKRTFLLSVLALALLMSSCATYNCPTYSKKTKTVEKQERI
jgi:hypothetical protein